MNIHKVVLYILDFDDVGADGVRDVLENTKYPNHCISPDVAVVETRDIGAWSDDHPLNHSDTQMAEYERVFGTKEPIP